MQTVWSTSQNGLQVQTSVCVFVEAMLDIDEAAAVMDPMDVQFPKQEQKDEQTTNDE